MMLKNVAAEYKSKGVFTREREWPIWRVHCVAEKQAFDEVSGVLVKLFEHFASDALFTDAGVSVIVSEWPLESKFCFELRTAGAEPYAFNMLASKFVSEQLAELFSSRKAQLGVP